MSLPPDESPQIATEQHDGQAESDPPTLSQRWHAGKAFLSQRWHVFPWPAKLSLLSFGCQMASFYGHVFIHRLLSDDPLRLWPWPSITYVSALAVGFGLAYYQLGQRLIPWPKTDPPNNAAEAKELKEAGDWWSVWGQAALLGAGMALNLHLWAGAESGSLRHCFHDYATVMMIFHFLEYEVTALTNPKNLTKDSFLLNHSTSYHLAAVVSWLEFGLQSYYAPGLKLALAHVVRAQRLGWLLCVGGDVLRKLAMFHAGSNFSHIVQNTKSDDHELVTDGVFAWMRHPSYVGWFYWSLGTQLLLANPLCLLAYGVVSWRFFNERAIIEECTLLWFFGRKYADYMQRVPTGLPWINGYDRVEEVLESKYEPGSDQEVDE